MSEISPSQALPGIRLAIGGGMWAFPELTGKAFGANLKGNHEALFLGRLFGIRDVALGIGQLANSGGMWWQLGVVCDLADAAAAVISIKAGGPKVTGVLAGLTAISAAGLGVAALMSGGSAETGDAA
jgi:hypothetical protein